MDRYNETMDFKKICRTCLLPSKTMMSVFSSIEVTNLQLAELPILDLLKIFTKISVSPDDGLPENICSDCIYKVHHSYIFKLTCEKSETILIQLKDTRQNMNELTNSLREYHYTDTSDAIIKTEQTVKKEQTEEEFTNVEEFDHDSISRILEQELSLVQEVKQEPEIEIKMEDVDFDGSEYNEECFKDDFQCTVCPLILTSSATLEAHLKMHSGDLPHKCKICAEAFAENHALIRHMVCHSSESLFKCKKCEESFQSNWHLTTHMQTVHSNDKRKFECKICSKLFRSKNYLNRHMKLHTEEKAYQCEVCLTKFRFNKNLKYHMQTVHADGTPPDDAKYKCVICSRLCVSEYDLNKHMRVHTRERPFLCEFCPKTFRYKQHFNDHMQAAHADGKTNNTTFKCTTCFKILGSKGFLERHMRTHIGDKQFQCEICPKKFRFKINLENHMRTEHGDGTTETNNFKCEICSKLFGRLGDLNRHMKIHRAENQHQCEVCLATFRFRKSLEGHIITVHAEHGANLFRCSICSGLRKSQNDLNRHMRLHTVENQFQCELCPSKFRFKTNLKDHMDAEHSDGTKDRCTFTCPTCFKIFGRKSHLNRHSKIHAAEKPFHCEFCLDKFRFKYNLRTHMQTVHNENLE